MLSVARVVSARSVHKCLKVLRGELNEKCRSLGWLLAKHKLGHRLRDAVFIIGSHDRISHLLGRRFGIPHGGAHTH